MRTYTQNRVVRMLREHGGTFSVRLGRYDASWNPADWWATIRGPADKITYTRLADGRIRLDIDRGGPRLVMGPTHQHVVSREAVPDNPASSDAPMRRRLLLVAATTYVAFAVGGYLIGFSLLSDRAHPIGVAGLVGGLFAAQVVQHVVVVFLGASHRLGGKGDGEDR